MALTYKTLRRVIIVFQLLAISVFALGVQPAYAQPLFLRAPFNAKPDGSYYRLTAYFDHQKPDYNTDGRMIIYNGEDVVNGNPYDYDGHSGYDWAMDVGTDVVASADGIVQSITNTVDGYGISICIKHPNGFSTRYGHLSESLVVITNSILAGQVIGHSGNTGHSSGPHLHFGVYFGAYCDDSENTATDPLGWTGSYSDPLINFPTIGQGKMALCLFRSSIQDPISCFDTIYEDKGRGSSISGSGSRGPFGNGYHRYYRFNSNGNEYAAWQFDINSTKSAQVYAWIPDTNANTSNAIYGIWTSSGWQYVHVNQQMNPNRWVLLGSFTFNPDPINNYIILSANTGEVTGSKHISADSIKFRFSHFVYSPLILDQCPNYDEFLMNGNFENGLDWWYTFRTPNNGVNFRQPRTGGGYAVRLGGSVNTFDFIDQGLSTIPSDVCPVILTFEGWVHSNEPSTTVRYDLMDVIFEQNEEFILQTFDNTNIRDTPVSYSIDISQYQGNSGYIRFSAHNDGSYPTEFWIDNVSIQVYH